MFATPSPLPHRDVRYIITSHLPSPPVLSILFSSILSAQCLASASPRLCPTADYLPRNRQMFDLRLFVGSSCSQNPQLQQTPSLFVSSQSLSGSRVLLFVFSEAVSGAHSQLPKAALGT